MIYLMSRWKWNQDTRRLAQLGGYSEEMRQLHYKSRSYFNLL